LNANISFSIAEGTTNAKILKDRWRKKKRTKRKRKKGKTRTTISRTRYKDSSLKRS